MSDLIILCRLVFFFFNDTATTEIYTLSLHDALPIYAGGEMKHGPIALIADELPVGDERDRKSTRLNSSHVKISYAVFCLKKKKKITSNRSKYRLKTDAPTFIYTFSHLN